MRPFLRAHKRAGEFMKKFAVVIITIYGENFSDGVIARKFVVRHWDFDQ